jgi:hypothetical protein
VATMQSSLSVAANGTSLNVVAGLLHEFVGNGARITFGACGSAVGLNTTLILNLPVIQDQAINLQNRFPIIPDDVLYQGMVRACRVFLTFRNTTAGALTAFWRVDVN